MEQALQAMNAASLAARMMLECSGEINRAEETAVRMCQAFGLDTAEILCFPTGLTISAQLADGRCLSRVMRVEERSIRLEVLDQVNCVSRMASQGRITAEEALKALEELRAKPASHPLLMIGAFAMSAGFFAVMFGGGIKEFLISFLCGALVQFVTPWLRQKRAPLLLSSLAGGFIAAGSALLCVLVIGGDQTPAISGAIMPLLPGLAMTNAIRDTMRGDLVGGMARSTEALLSAVLIAGGVALALLL